MCNGDCVSGIFFILLCDVVGWEYDFYVVMNNIQDEIDFVGESVVSIDVYVVIDFVECFVVLLEYFFSVLELFVLCFLVLWQCFCQFYCQDFFQCLWVSVDEGDYGEEFEY